LRVEGRGWWIERSAEEDLEESRWKRKRRGRRLGKRFELKRKK
jgi:hypothetical protein